MMEGEEGEGRVREGGRKGMKGDGRRGKQLLSGNDLVEIPRGAIRMIRDQERRRIANRVAGRQGGRMDGRVGGRVDGRMGGRVGGRVGGRMEG